MINCDPEIQRFSFKIIFRYKLAPVSESIKFSMVTEMWQEFSWFIVDELYKKNCYIASAAPVDKGIFELF